MNPLNTSTLRPGLLVSLKTSCRGNCRYDKVDLELEHSTEQGEAQAKWQTTRTIADKAEFEAAKKVQAKAASLIRSACTASAFGLLCPEADAEVLADRVREAHALVDDFNASASLTRVGVYVISGRVAADDVEAVKAISSEVRGLMESMAQGIESLDVSLIRSSANKAKAIGNMLSPEAEARVKLAIDTARSAARKIAKAGDEAAIEVDRVAIRKISEARTAFLDIPEDEAAQISKPTAQSRSIDLNPDAIAEDEQQQARRFMRIRAAAIEME